jgi:hypothetical protein
MNKEFEALDKQLADAKTILIIGCPASGKTHLSQILAASRPYHKVIHTDDYQKHGYGQALYEILSDIEKLDHHLLIIEGVQGYRMLRKGVQQNNFFPDVVIELEVTEHRMLQTYRKERAVQKQRYLNSFGAMHQKILKDYRALPNPHPPKWFTITNRY